MSWNPPMNIPSKLEKLANINENIYGKDSVDKV
jgi:hypothetical protein